VATLSLPGWATAALTDLDAVGVSVWGVADGASWQHVLEGCRSVIVVGSSGSALWDEVMRRHQQGQRPSDPIDAVVRQALQPHLHRSTNRTWIRCANDAHRFVDFRKLALGAGLGWPSRLGLVLHPEAGVWWGLRAACFTTEQLPLSQPLPGEGPCASCAAPCVTACPVDALTPRYDVQRCADWQRDQPTCEGGCLARSACPHGSPYGVHQHRYHHHGPSRQRALAAAAHQDGSVA
jgi:epoxyqueuosine reductase